MEPVDHGADVELDEVALLEHASAGDAVDDLVVDGGADGLREAAVPEERRRRAAAGDLPRGGVVELLGRDARPDCGPGGVDRRGDDLAGAPHRGDLLARLRDDHALSPTFRSISFTIRSSTSS